MTDLFLFGKPPHPAKRTFMAPQRQATTPIKFQLDWRFEGPCLFLPATRGCWLLKAAGLDVTGGMAGNGLAVRCSAWHRARTTWVWLTWLR